MADKLVLDGLTVAPNVINTIVGIAATTVEGVVSVYAPTLRKASGSKGIEIATDADGKLLIGVHIVALYGTKLRELGESVQSAIKDALAVQLGAEPASIDIFIDALAFPE